MYNEDNKNPKKRLTRDGIRQGINNALKPDGLFLILFSLLNVLMLLVVFLTLTYSYIFAGILGIITAASLIYEIYLGVRMFRILRLVREERYTVVQDKLLGISEMEDDRQRHRYSWEWRQIQRNRGGYRFVFEGYGDYFLSFVEEDQYHYSMCGDLFYLVMLPGIEYPMAVFNTRIYELSDEFDAEKGEKHGGQEN